EGLRVGAPAFEARTVASRERGDLVEEEQLGVVAAPDVALASLEVQDAADPLPRRPAPVSQGAVVAMKLAAAIAEQQPARGIGDERTERIDAILQRHGAR